MNRSLPARFSPILLTFLLLPLISPETLAQRRRAQTPPPIPPACIDFYQDTHHDWLAAHPSRYGMETLSALGELRERALGQQYELLNTLMAHPASDAQRALGTFWRKGFDVESIEADGLAAAQPLLAQINAIARARDVAPVLARLHVSGLGAGFSFHAGPDPEGSGRLMGTFSGAALGLPDPDYYLREDGDSRLLLAHYTLYVQDILRLTGTPEAELRTQMEQVLNLETRLARLMRSLPAAQAPTPDGATNAPITDADTQAPPPGPVRANTAELAKRYRHLQLAAFFVQHGMDAPTEVVITHPALLPGLNRLIGALKPEQWAIYLRYHLGHTLAPYLGGGFVEAGFAFYGTILRAESVPPSPPQQVLNAVNRMLGPHLGHLYIARYLEPETRAAASEIAANVRAALQRSVEASAWISAAAKAKALTRLNALKIEIAAPSAPAEDDNLPDFSADSFARMYVEASRWRMAQDMRRIGRPDETERHWDVLPQEPVLAYDPARNRLIVSAAALQPPIFDHHAPRAAQYGSYGALVGRELSRALEADGQHDEGSDGWSEADLRTWEHTRAQLAAQYSAYPWPNTPDARVDGARTAGENLADLAGLELAWDALDREQPNLDADARDAFFRAWAGLWREQTGPETARYNALTQSRTPGQWRSNGPLVNLPAFAQTYHCPPGSAMTRPAEEQIAIWRLTSAAAD